MTGDDVTWDGYKLKMHSVGLVCEAVEFSPDRPPVWLSFRPWKRRDVRP